MGQRIQDQVVLITGATDGLGKHVARDLAERGAIVLLHGRNPEKGAATLQEIRAATDNDRLTYYNADFSSLEAVRRLAEEIQADQDRLDVLINNAGLGERGGAPREESAEGHELLFAVNYLAPFLLTHRLLPLLRRSSPARIVNVASAGQQSLDFDDVMLEEGAYDGFGAYMQSKLAQVMFTFDLAEKLADSGVTVNALHPATYMDTKMVRASGITPRSAVEEGAEAVKYLAISSDLDRVTGQYFNGKQRARANAQAYDVAARRRLWQLSERLAGTKAFS